MPRTSNQISNRTFGVEVEFVGISCEAAVRALTAAGIPMRQDVSYNHENSSTHWKVVTDSSVEGPGGSGELVSPILKGEEGLVEVDRTLRALSSAGATVNRTCGLHVHVGARDLTARQIAEVCARYAECETRIDRIMPRSRRGSNSYYCRPTGLSYDMDRLRQHTSLSQLARHTYERFCKMNLQSLDRHGTVEIRHHSGSVNATKVTNWIRFCVNFVEQTAGATGIVRRTRRTRRTGSTRRPNGLARVAAYYAENRGGIRTEDQIAEATGVSVASVTVFTSNLRRQYGWEIKRVRYCGGFRCLTIGNMPPGAEGASTPAVETSNSGCTLSPSDYTNPFFGLPRDVVSYYQEREMDLAEG